MTEKQCIRCAERNVGNMKTHKINTINNFEYLLILRLLTLCLLSCCAMAAKSFVIFPLPTQSQLPVGNIHCIFQDSEGYMWYGTRGGGLCRDNGYQIDKLGENNIRCITEDGDGKIWFGTTEGVCYIDKRDYKVRKTPFKGETTALLCDSKGRVWASVAHRIVCIHARSGHVIYRNDHVKCDATYIYEDGEKRIWILFWNKQIWRYAPSQSFKPTVIHVDEVPMRMIEYKRQNGYLIATWGKGVCLMDKGTHALRPLETTDEATDRQQYVLDMKWDPKRKFLYVSAMDNLFIYRLEGNKLLVVNTHPFMSAHKKVLDGLWIDRTDNLWVSGFIPTTFILSPDNASIHRYDIPQVVGQTGFPLIADRCLQDENHLWISQGRIGLMIYNKQTETLLSVPSLVSNSRLIEKKKGESGVWGCKNHVLMSLSVDGINVKSVPVYSFDSDICMIRDQGKFLLVGTDNGLYKLWRKDNSPHAYAARRLVRTAQSVVSAMADVDGQVYYALKDGAVYKYTTERKPECVYDKRFKVRAMDIGHDGTLWVGTDDGKVFSKQGTQRKLQTALCNQNHCAIIDIQVDYLRHVWTLSDQWLKEFNTVNQQTRIYHCQDADIQVANFYQLECTEDNRVGVGAAGAYFEITPSLTLNHTVKRLHPVVVSSFRLADSIYIMPKGQKEIQIPSGMSYLKLNLTTNEPLKAKNISFAYQVEGSNGWVELPQGVNSAYLNNIPVGQSVLLLKATDEYGKWSSDTTRIVLNHIPYWWQRTWVRVLFVLLGVGFVYLLWILNKRIQLLSNLQKMRKRLSLNEVEIKQGHETQALKAEEDMKKIVELIEAHIADSDYNVQSLSEDMCMSRTNLYRRVHAMSGLSITEFIRDIRLKQAASILSKHPDISLTSVFTSVGFTTNSYFTKCFKNKFGMTPSEYAKQQTERPKDE